MRHGQFVFVDLSTYDVDRSKRFYHALFGWQYEEDDEGYCVAYAHTRQVCGIYQTPQMFQDMNMPHFWMTYIQVDSRDETVRIAQAHGATIEATQDMPFGKIALIRDPLGAGFTIYEGDSLDTRTANVPGTCVWNELWVSDLDAVQSFYQTIFGREYQYDEQLQRLEIMADGTSVGVIQQIDDERRGAYQYWGVFFAVTNKAQAIQTITRNGGRVLVDDGSYTSCLDHSGSAFFFLVEVAESSSRLDRLFPYKPLVALVVIFVSLALSWYGIFGVLFLLFAYHDIRSGHTYLFDVVYKKNNPLLFWVIVGTWVLLSIVSIVYYTYVIVI